MRSRRHNPAHTAPAGALSRPNRKVQMRDRQQAVLMMMAALLTLLAGNPAAAQAAPQVATGAYVSKIESLNFRENKYAIDFYVWFRWKAEGPLADYKPLDSFELINGKIENKSSVVEKKIGDVSYATVRVSATMSETWDLARFPFDSHSITVKIEDSSLTAKDLVFVADKSNSGLGDEIDMAGWTASNFVTDVQTKVYRTNYGDVSLPTNASSEYSRFMFSVDIERRSQGSAIKLLSTVLLATAVAFVAFLVKPSDLDARFGMGIGSLFAVTASAFISASLVPDSGEMTLADKMHMIALAFIFGTLLLSALCLKLEVSRRRELAFRIDRIAVVVLPLLFYGWAAWAIAHNIR